MLARVAVLVAAGIGGGIVASLTLTKFIAALLYGIAPNSPSTFFVASLALALVALAAAGLPAWRASRMDPAAVLRNE